jgi:hypothetical protein
MHAWIRRCRRRTAMCIAYRCVCFRRCVACCLLRCSVVCCMLHATFRLVHGACCIHAGCCTVQGCTIRRRHYPRLFIERAPPWSPAGADVLPAAVPRPSLPRGARAHRGTAACPAPSPALRLSLWLRTLRKGPLWLRRLSSCSSRSARWRFMCSSTRTSRAARATVACCVLYVACPTLHVVWSMLRGLCCAGVKSHSIHKAALGARNMMFALACLSSAHARARSCRLARRHSMHLQNRTHVHATHVHACTAHSEAAALAHARPRTQVRVRHAVRAGHAQLAARLRPHLPGHASTCTHTPAHTHTRARAHTHTHTCIHKDTRTHTHARTHTRT